MSVDPVTQTMILELAPWFQSVTFPNGVSVGSWDTDGMLSHLTQGVELSGRTVLDAGAMSGVGTLWLERRGADCEACEIDSLYLKQFELVKLAFGMQAECRRLSVYDIPPAVSWDVVVAAGLYYHLRHPLLGLEKLWGATRSTLLIESEVLNEAGCWALFCPGEYKGDGSNWWIPTRGCLLDWLVGLDGVGKVVDVTPTGYLSSRVLIQVWRS